MPASDNPLFIGLSSFICLIPFYIVPKITGELMAALSLRTVFGEGFYPMYSVSSSAVNAIGTQCSSNPMMNLPEGMSVKMMIAFPSLL